MRRILVNELTSWRRTASRRSSRRHLLQVVDQSTFADVDGQLDLWRLVSALPPRQRAVVVLRYYEDMTEAEIASTLGIARGTVKSQAADGLRRLAALAGENPHVQGKEAVR